MKCGYIIWGCGVRGKIVEEMLDREEIVAFVDENLSTQEQFYKGIAIWNKRQLIEKYNDEVVVVTPRGYEDEIIEWLNKEKIYNTTKWELEQWQVIAFEKQLDKKKLINRFDIGETYKVYGNRILSEKVINWLGEFGIAAHICNNIENIEHGDRVVITKAIENQEERNILSHCISVDIYSLNQDIANIKIDDLSKFHNKHKGERCFIVATGPSLRVEDLDILYKNNVCGISVNSIYNIFDKTSWRPKYYGISDIVGYMDMEKNILTMDVENKFIMDAMWDESKHTEERGFYKWHLIVEDEKNWNPSFSDDINRGFFWGKTITYDFALQFAVYLGFKEIYLLGVDCNYVKGGENNHFTKSGKPDYYDHQEDKMIMAYQSAKRYADSHGIKIYNATRGGMLEVFERVEFDSLFEKDTE